MSSSPANASGSMSAPTYQFHLRDPGLLPGLVHGVQLRERITTPYRCRLTLRGTGEEYTARLGHRAWLQIDRPEAGVRRVHGLIARVQDVANAPGEPLVTVDLVPALALLGQRVNYRIYQDRDVASVVREVLRDAGIYPGGDRAWRLRRALAPRGYCVQYGETDLDFMHRLLAEEGLAYLFQQGPEAEHLVLLDDPSGATRLDSEPLAVTSRRGMAADRESVWALRWDRRVGPTSVTVEDYDPAWPEVVDAMRVTFPAGQPGERAVRIHPGNFVEAGAVPSAVRSQGRFRARLAYTSRAARTVKVRGASDVAGLSPGVKIAVDDPARQATQELVILAVDHRGGEGGFSNRFVAVTADTAAWPRRYVRRPVVSGPQTARVVSTTGEPIDVDQERRVLVRFRWDLRQGIAQPTCRIRVAQALAGAGFGTVFLPREGMEVVVQFLEGDPDRPLVTGCVYNGENPPPHERPEEATRTSIRTRHVPHGHGHHELTFDDAEEHPEVYLHAGGAFRERVDGNHTLSVAGTRVTTVGRHGIAGRGMVSTEEVFGNSLACVHGVHAGQAQSMRHVVLDEFRVSAMPPASAGTAQPAPGPATVTVSPSCVRLDSGAGASIELRGEQIVIRGKQVLIQAENEVTVKTEQTLTLMGLPVLINC